MLCRHRKANIIVKILIIKQELFCCCRMVKLVRRFCNGAIQYGKLAERQGRKAVGLKAAGTGLRTARLHRIHPAVPAVFAFKSWNKSRFILNAAI